MQLGVLHVAQDAAGIVELAVVQVGQGGQGLGVAWVAAGHQQAMAGQVQDAAEPGELTHQHLDIALRIEQVKASRTDLLRGRVVGQEPLLLQFPDAELGRAVGLEQARFGGKGGVLAGLGVLQFIKQHGGDQHRIDLLATAFTEDDGPEFLEPAEGVSPQRLQLIKALGEELGQLRLGPMHPEAAAQFRELLGCEIERVGSLALIDRTEGIGATRATRRLGGDRAVGPHLTDRPGSPGQMGTGQHCRQGENPERPGEWPSPGGAAAIRRQGDATARTLGSFMPGAGAGERRAQVAALKSQIDLRRSWRFWPVPQRGVWAGPYGLLPAHPACRMRTCLDTVPTPVRRSRGHDIASAARRPGSSRALAALLPVALARRRPRFLARRQPHGPR